MVTNYQANKSLNYDFGKTVYTPPETWYIGVSTTPILKDGTGYTEPVDSAYKRVAIANNKTDFTVASNGSLIISKDIIFDESTISWGLITHVFIANSLTGNDICFYDELDNEEEILGELVKGKLVQSRSTLIFPSGELVISN